MRRLAALVPNLPEVSPGQRFRVETWAKHLHGRGWEVDLYGFEDDRLHRVIYQPGRVAQKATALVGCYGRQLRRVRHMLPCDAVLIYREAALVGPAIIERLARRLPVPLIFDLDDPTFVPYRSPTSGWWSALKFPAKTKSLFRMADRVITVNRKIGDFAATFNPSVTVIPNFVDTDWYRPADRDGHADDVPAMIWTGSHTTASNLLTIEPALRRIQQQRRCCLRVVCDGPVGLSAVAVEERPFSAATQVRDLQDGHIGLVPVTDHPWNHWKTFFKAVQYMAVGLPVVARRIGSNDEVIEDGVNGYLVETQDEWVDRLRILIDDPGLRAKMGRAARETVMRTYSASVQMPRVEAVLDSALGS